MLLSTATPDRYTHQARAELVTATVASISWGLGSLKLTSSLSSIGATLLFMLGAWGLSRNKDDTTTESILLQYATPIDRAIQTNIQELRKSMKDLYTRYFSDTTNS